MSLPNESNRFCFGKGGEAYNGIRKVLFQSDRREIFCERTEQIYDYIRKAVGYASED